jgi:DNA-binding NarL/FixJ family response regulator
MKANRNRPARLAEKRILIVDDHPMTRYGIAQLIGQEHDLAVCGEVENAHRALAAVKTLKPDLVLADLAMPGKSGLELIRELKIQHPDVAVLVVSMHDESIYAERVLRAGGRGYLMKSAGGEKLIQAIRRVLSGQVCVSEAMSDRIMDVFAGRRPGGARDSTLATLTEREFGVFELLGQGLTTRETAKNLHISAKTVETHRLHIVEKLKLKGSSELTKFAICWVRAQGLV